MAKLGFLGLGIMGYPMARNLLNKGHEVAVWSFTASKMEALRTEAGALPCATPREVAAAAEVVFLCVGDTAMAETVILGKDGLVEGAAPGCIIVDTSTVAPSASVAIAEALAARGIHFLGAPVTGSKPGAEGGTLTFMVGGEREVYERAKPYMEAMGANFYYCGGHGAGLHAKLTQNLILSNLLQAFNEGMILCSKAGVDPELMLDILNNSAARSGLVSFKAPYVFARNFETNFSIKWMHKDVGLMLQSGDEQGVPLPLTALTQQMLKVAIAEGYGDEDICASIKVLERIAGVQVKKSEKL
ncbi:MAG: NAD(P)-dependent oxidoreductase [Bryobacterales bacterium]|jgi:3-hydroxyisobutyrate dehydrogenase/2-hydroxy-3-oxopropionate reductase|nr:NAD(P)-dependent oxidoreductase [Bryobacterales bacterium]